VDVLHHGVVVAAQLEEDGCFFGDGLAEECHSFEEHHFIAMKFLVQGIERRSRGIIYFTKMHQLFCKWVCEMVG